MIESDKKMLVIRLSAMGDCAMAVPVILRLITAYPYLKISILTKAFFVPIFECLPGNVEVMAAETKKKHKGFLGVVKLAKQLKKKKFSYLADLHDVLRSKIIRTEFAIGNTKAATIDKGRREKKALTRAENKIFKQLATTPERYAKVFAELGFPVDLNRKITLEKPELPARIKSHIGNGGLKWVGIAPFAAHPSKTFPTDLMMELIGKLCKSQKMKILLFGGGKKEIEQLQKFENEFPNTMTMAGKLNFDEEIKLIAHLDAMISMDSGNGHLAAMFDVPVLTLWGSTHPYAGFAPFAQPAENQFLPDLEKYPLLPTSVFGNKEVEGYEEVMRTIQPDKVVDRLMKILELE